MSIVVFIARRPSQRETSRIGAPLAMAVEAKECGGLLGVYLALPPASTRLAATHAFLKWKLKVEVVGTALASVTWGEMTSSRRRLLLGPFKSTHTGFRHDR